MTKPSVSCTAPKINENSASHVESHEIEITAGTFIRAGNVASLSLLTVHYMLQDHWSWWCWLEAVYVQYWKIWSVADWTLLHDIHSWRTVGCACAVVPYRVPLTHCTVLIVCCKIRTTFCGWGIGCVAVTARIWQKVMWLWRLCWENYLYCLEHLCWCWHKCIAAAG